MSKLLSFLPSWAPAAAIGVLLAALAGGALALRAAWIDEGAARVELVDVRAANEALLKEARDSAAFQDEVRQGFQALAGRMGELQKQNTAYSRKVAANASSKDLLDDGDRAALCELFGCPAPGGDGRANAVRGAGPPR